MKNIIEKIACIFMVMLVPIGLIGSVTVTENLFDGNVIALLIGLILMVISGIMFAFILIADRIL